MSARTAGPFRPRAAVPILLGVAALASLPAQAAAAPAAPAGEPATLAAMLAAAPAAGPAAGPAAREEVRADRLGLVVPLSGADQAWGRAVLAGVNLAVEEANRNGWRQFRLEVRDGGGEDRAAAAVALARGARCAVVLGGDAAVPGFPALPSAAAPGLDGDRREARLLARLAAGVLGKRRCAALRAADAPSAAAVAAFAEELARAGGSLVADAVLDPGGRLNAAARDTLAAARPEALLLLVPAPRLASLAADLRRAELACLLLGPGGWDGGAAPALLDSLPGRAVCAAADAGFPAAWREDFARLWARAEAAAAVDEGEKAAAAAAALARRAYLSARFALAALAAEQPRRRGEVGPALSRQWEKLQRAPLDDAEAARSVRLVTAGAASPLPAWLLPAAGGPGGRAPQRRK